MDTQPRFGDHMARKQSPEEWTKDLFFAIQAVQKNTRRDKAI